MTRKAAIADALDRATTLPGGPHVVIRETFGRPHYTAYWDQSKNRPYATWTVRPGTRVELEAAGDHVVIEYLDPRQGSVGANAEGKEAL